MTGRVSVGLRERALLFGFERLADIDLLALLVAAGGGGRSAWSVAAGLLETAGGVVEMSRLSPHALSTHSGIGPATATRILAAIELGHRVALGNTMEIRPRMQSFEAVVEWARPRLSGLDHEEVWLFTLDARNGLRSARRIAQGGLHACALTPRDVLRPALRDAASAIILAHNHPSGDPTPSVDDVNMTRALFAACEVVGIQLFDHVVVARDGASSLRDIGALPNA